VQALISRWFAVVRMHSRGRRLRAPESLREKLEGWLDLVRTMWRQCPASIDQDGTGLFVDRANAVLPGGTDGHR
jgi:hypothetical protein